jgi:hypothetical protein
MTGIGGPGGIDGPGKPGGVGGPDGPDGPDDVDGAGAIDRGASVDAAATADPLSALAADVEAGRLTPQAALDRIIDQTVSPDLAPAERAELREIIADLVATDPHLAGLLGGLR